METKIAMFASNIELEVLILPMRNGNYDNTELWDEVDEVLILPMRNGNDMQTDLLF